MGKRIVSIICILFIGLFLSSCWDYQEINNVTNVAGIAIDKGEEKRLKLTFETIVFKPSADYDISVKLVESEGDTIFEGIRNAVAVAGKRLYIGHCKAVIFSEEIAKEGIKEYLDFFMRDHELRMTLLVFIARGVEAKDTLNDTALIHQIASYELERLVRNDEKYSSLSSHKQLYEVMMELLDPGIELTLPIVEIKQVDDNKTFTMEGVFFFSGDKLIGSVEAEDIKFYLILVNKLKGGVLSVPIPESPEHYIVYEIQDAGTSFKYAKSSEPILNVETKMKTSIGTNQMIYSKHFTNEEYQQILEKWLKQELAQFFKKMQTEVKSDICGFERLYFRKQYDKWEKIASSSTSFIEQLKLNIKVSVDIDHSGMAKP